MSPHTPIRRLGRQLQFASLRLANPRTQLATLTLLAVLQKSPALLRLFNGAKHSVEPATRILQKLALTTASLGSYHALSGATTAVYDTDPEGPFAFDIGEEVTILFGVSNTMEEASSWTVSGNVPPGLVVSGAQGAQQNNQGIFNERFGKIAGAPTQPGTYDFSVQPWQRTNARGNTAEAFQITITVNAPPLVAPKAQISTTPTDIIVAWTTRSGQSYHLQSTNNPLDENSWSPFPATIKSDGDLQTVSLPKSSLPRPLILRVASSTN